MLVLIGSRPHILCVMSRVSTKTAGSLVLLLCLLALVSNCGIGEKTPQPARPVADRWVATVGADTIKAAGFRSLYEIWPQADTGYVQRRASLEYLVNEHLFAQAAEQRGVEKEPSFIYAMRQFTAEARVDAWLRDKLNITASDQEVREQFIKATQELEIAAWVSEDSVTARMIAGMATSGSVFQRAGQFRNKRGAVYIPSLTVYAGESNPEFERMLFTLETGETAGPIKLDRRWWFIRLTSRRAREIPHAANYKIQKPWLRETVLYERAYDTRQELEDSLRLTVDLDIDTTALLRLASVLHENLPAPRIPHHLRRPLAIHPDPAAVRVLRQRSKIHLDSLLLNISTPDTSFSWSVRSTLTRLAMGPWPLEWYSDSTLFAAHVRDQIESHIVLELMDRFAIKAGYEDDPRVVRDSLRWRRHVLAREGLAQRFEQIGVTGWRQDLYPDDGFRPANVKIPRKTPASQAALWAATLRQETKVQINEDVLQKMELYPPPSVLRMRHVSTRPLQPPPPAVLTRTLE